MLLMSLLAYHHARRLPRVVMQHDFNSTHVYDCQCVLNSRVDYISHRCNRLALEKHQMKFALVNSATLHFVVLQKCSA